MLVSSCCLSNLRVSHNEHKQGNVMNFTGNQRLCKYETFQRSFTSYALHDESLIHITTVSLSAYPNFWSTGDTYFRLELIISGLVKCCCWLMFGMFFMRFPTSLPHQHCYQERENPLAMNMRSKSCCLLNAKVHG